MDTKSLILSFVAAFIVLADIILALLLSVTLPKYITHPDHYPTDWELTPEEEEYYCPCNSDSDIPADEDDDQNGKKGQKGKNGTDPPVPKCKNSVRLANGYQYYDVNKPTFFFISKAIKEAEGVLIDKDNLITRKQAIRYVMEHSKHPNTSFWPSSSNKKSFDNVLLYNKLNNETVGKLWQLPKKSQQKYLKIGLITVKVNATLSGNQEYYTVSNDSNDIQQVLHIVGDRSKWFSIYNNCTNDNTKALFYLCVNGSFNPNYDDNTKYVYLQSTGYAHFLIFATNCTENITIVGVGISAAEVSGAYKYDSIMVKNNCQLPLYKYDYEKCSPSNITDCYC